MYNIIYNNRETMNNLSGTPISKLQDFDNLENLEDLQEQHYKTNYNLMHEQGHNAAHSIHQAQHNKYYNIPEPNHPRQHSISELAKEISESLPENIGEELDLQEYEEEEEEEVSKGYIPTNLVDPLIITILYLALSHPFSRNIFGKYINQLKPDYSGNISWNGVFIYAVILSVLFTVTKRMLF
jgi:hypothetical protein